MICLRHTYGKFYFVILTVTSVFGAFLSSALAQSTPVLDRATEQPDRAIQKQVKEKLKTFSKDIFEITPQPVEPTEGVKFYVSEIILEGIESFDPEEFRSLLEPYEQRDVRFEELQQLTKIIEQEFLKRGIIAACLISPRDIVDGKVVLQVIEAKMGHLQIKDHDHFKKTGLYNYWQPTTGKTLRYSEIARSLFLMNKNPDRDVKASLHAGAIPGTTDVLLDVQTRFPVHMTATVDKEGASSTGRWRTGLGMKHNNFLGLDDTLLGGYLWGNDFSGYYIYHSLPVTDFGTTLVYGYSFTESFPKKEFESIDIESRSETLSLTVRQDIFD